MFARLSALALALGTMAVVAPPASAETGGVVFGTIWLDENEDGIRQPGEPGVPGYSLMLTDMYTGVTSTDENGNYRFENIRPGQYFVGRYAASGWAFTKPGGDSVFDPFTERTGYVPVTEGGETGPINGGVVKARQDVEVTDLVVPRKLPPVGQEVKIDVTFRNAGNTPEALYGNVLLPAGLTPVSTNAPVPWIDGQRIHLSSMYMPPARQGDSVTYTVVARVDAKIKCGEVVAEAELSYDIDTTNNIRKATVRG